MTTHAAVPEDEIGAPAAVAAARSVPFGRKLRLALESLKEGQGITIRTKTERQHVTNIVGTVQKKTGRRFETHLLVRRTDDPEGKIVIQINRVASAE